MCCKCCALDTFWAPTVSDPNVEDQGTLVYEGLEKKWGIAKFIWRGSVYEFVRNNYTRDIYNEDPTCLIRFKFLLLCVGTPLAAMARSIVNLVTGIFCYLARREGAKEAFEDVVRAPLYGALGVGAALYGLIRPYEGRKLYHELERSFNRQDVVDQNAAFYLARCFIAYNHRIADKGNQERTIARLKYLIQKFNNNENGEIS